MPLDPAPIVYFIGAGLTKALQGADRVPVMADFMDVVADYAAADPIIRRALLELDRSDFRDWTPSAAHGTLAEKVAAGDREALSHYLRSLRRLPSENIETLLGRALARDPAAGTTFICAINRVFWLTSKGLNLEPLVRFIRSQSSAHPGHRFVAISFNYDLAFESALHRALVWFPCNECGTDFESVLWSERIAEQLREHADGGRKESVLFEGDPVPAPGVPSRWSVLKPHGSLNWLWTSHRMGPMGLSIVLNRSGEVAYIEEHDLPSVGVIGGQPIGIAIRPPGDKAVLGQPYAGDHRHLRLREAQLKAVSEAECIYVLGWSIPPTDGYQESLIRVAIHERRTPLKKLVVVNYNAPPEYYYRVRALFGCPAETVAANHGFVDFAE